jgi:hypothetical protein
VNLSQPAAFVRSKPMLAIAPVARVRASKEEPTHATAYRNAIALPACHSQPS